LIFDGGEEINYPMMMKIPPRSTTRRRRQLYRPSRNTLAKSEWTASAGLQYQQISIRDGDGDLSPEDELGNESFLVERAKTIYSPYS